MDFRISIVENPELRRLKDMWGKLEIIAKPTYFLSWSWIENWLSSYQPEITIVYAEYNNRVVAIGIFTKSIEQRHKIVKSRQMRLNQIGDAKKDQIWIEYNDFIADPAFRVKAVNLCLNELMQYSKNSDELVISMMFEKYKNEYEVTNTNAHILDQKPTFLVDLCNLRNQNKPYLNALSKNTRYQIRRSIKEYEDLNGEICVQKASSVDEAIELYFIAGEGHKSRWNDSGFKNCFFNKFHINLIGNNFNKGEIEILQVTAGSDTIGVSYNFVYNNNIYFYLNGLFYQQNNKLKPGLVLHSLLIQRYLDEGYNGYYFMGGYSRYKESLATRSSDLITIAIQKPCLIFSIENLARKLKNHYLN